MQAASPRQGGEKSNIGKRNSPKSDIIKRKLPKYIVGICCEHYPPLIDIFFEICGKFWLKSINIIAYNKCTHRSALEDRNIESIIYLFLSVYQ